MESRGTCREQGLRGGQRAPRQEFKSRQPGFISSTVIEQLVSQFFSWAKKLEKGVICTAQLLLVLKNLYLLAFQILLSTMEACAGRRFDLSSASWTEPLHWWGKEKMHHNIDLEVQQTSGCFKYSREEFASFQRGIFSASFHLHRCAL